MTTSVHAEPVKINSFEFAELKAGADRILGSLKRAGQLNSALGFDTPSRENLEAQRVELIQLLQDEPAGTIKLPATTLWAAGVATRLRHRELVSAQKKDEKAKVAENPDTAKRIEVCEKLGKKFGLQLELVDHGDDEKDDE